MLVVLVSFAVMIIGCIHTARVNYPEFPEYKIFKSGSFIVSESPEFWHFYTRPWRKSKEITAEFLAQNYTATSASVYLKQAKILINLETSPIACQTNEGSADTMAIAPEARVRIKCTLEIVPNEKNQLRLKDTIAVVEVPTDSETIKIERLLRIEEFEK